MPEYTMFFSRGADEQRRCAAFTAEGPAQAFVIAHQHMRAAHLLADGKYLCSLECRGEFWAIFRDPAGAVREAFANGFENNATSLPDSLVGVTELRNNHLVIDCPNGLNA